MRVKGTLVILVIALFLALPQLAMAVKVHDFDCNNCHLAGQSFMGADNICLQCHKPGDPDVPVESGQFSVKDMSNHYGNNPALDPLNETSHNWAAASVNKAAGAKDPLLITGQMGFYSRYGATSGKVACSRCHNPHGEVENNPKLLKGLSYSFNSDPMTPNAMCVACHQDFANMSDPANHGLLTHPMLNSAELSNVLADTGAGGRGEFIDMGTIEDYNPDNPYNSAIVKYQGGIACVSCHGLHFTDSDYDTAVDGPGASLSQGDGLLLRGDGVQFYNSAATNGEGVYRSVTFCNSCHKFADMGIHGSPTNGGIGCMGCHGGHNYNADGSSYYMLINGYQSLPSNEAERAALWAGTQAGELDGMCETCHGNFEENFPTLPPATGYAHDTGITDCKVCHGSHTDTGGFSKPKGCDTCHGSAPTLDLRGDQNKGGFAWSTATTNRYNAATGIYKDESQTPHDTHANGGTNYGFGCEYCHGSDYGSTDHDNGSFQTVLNYNAGTLPDLTKAGGDLAPSYTLTGAGTCDTVYCHSNGGINDGTGTRTYSFPYQGYGVDGAAPTWANGNNTIYNAAVGVRCASCHDVTDTLVSSDAHKTHLDAGFDCSNCHADTASGLNTLNGIAPASHVNGGLDVKFGTTVKGNTVAHDPNTTNPFVDPAAMTCDGVYCHSTGQDAVPADRVFKPVSWDADLGTMTCTSCHDITTGTDQTVAHAAHINGSASFVGRDLDCNICHDDTMNAGDYAANQVNDIAFHVNGQVDINMDTAIKAGGGSCSSISCHSDGNYGGSPQAAPANPQYNTVAWTTGTGSLLSACDKCHGSDSQNKSYPAYPDGNEGTADANSHNKHAGASNISCEVCHSSTTLDSVSIVPGGDHVNQVINVTNTATLSFNNTAKTCSATDCHGGGTPVWGGAVDCGDCHAANKTLADSHTVHYNTTIVGDTSTASINYNATTNGYVIQCGVCHTSTGADKITHGGGWVVPTDITAEVKFDGVISSGTTAPTSKYNSGTTFKPDNGFSYSDATCTNLYCHGDFGGNGNNATAQWGVASSAACGTCHDVDTTTLDGSAHNFHVTEAGGGLTCDNCHGATAVDAAGGIDDKALHANQQLNIDLNTTDNRLGASATYNSTNMGGSPASSGTIGKAFVGAGPYGSCDNIYCHSDVQTDPPGGGLTYNAANWTIGDVTCGDCHKGDGAGGISLMDSGSHTPHVNTATYAYTCDTCHENHGADGDPALGQITHGNYEVNVAMNATTLGGSYNGSVLPGDNYGSCTSTSCHNDGRGNQVETPQWGTASVPNCTECHTTMTTDGPATGSHAIHLTTTIGTNPMRCDSCHSGSPEPDTDTAPSADHLNGLIDVAASEGYGPPKAYNSAFLSCSSASDGVVGLCHDNGRGITVDSPIWGTDVTDCSTCHAKEPTTGSHTVHLSSTEAGGITCSACHDDADPTAQIAPGQHGDGNIDVYNSATTDLGYPADVPLHNTAIFSTCNAASCHDDGTGQLVETPNWGTPSACAECHAAAPATGAHATHLSASANGITDTITCVNCHNDAVFETTAPTGDHRDGNIDVYNSAIDVGGGVTDLGYPTNASSTAPLYNTVTCNTSYCHGDNMPKNTTSGTTNAPTWGGTYTVDCDFCHKVTATAGTIPSHSGVTLTDCHTCHDNVLADGSGFVDKTLHMNGTLEGGGDSCSDCHFNVGTDPRSSGAHAAHNKIAYTGALSTNDYGNASNGWYDVTYNAAGTGSQSFGCGFCHPSTVAGHMTKQVSLDPTDAGATGTVKEQNAADAAYAGSGGACSGTYCHSDGVNINTTDSVSPDWATGSLTGNCNDCHGNSPDTNAHQVHEVAIHYEELYDDDGEGLMAPAYNATLLTASGGTYAAHGNPGQVQSTITCFTCHSSTVADSANAGNETCNNCHSDSDSIIDGNELARILKSSTTHINGTKDVAFADLSNYESKAQLRDNLSDASIIDMAGKFLSDIWTRVSGYKASDGSSYDTFNSATLPSHVQTTTTTCSSVACHNGEDVDWNKLGDIDPAAYAPDCMECHTSLPK